MLCLSGARNKPKRPARSALPRTLTTHQANSEQSAKPHCAHSDPCQGARCSVLIAAAQAAQAHPPLTSERKRNETIDTKEAKRGKRRQLGKEKGTEGKRKGQRAGRTGRWEGRERGGGREEEGGGGGMGSDTGPAPHRRRRGSGAQRLSHPLCVRKTPEAPGKTELLSLK